MNNPNPFVPKGSLLEQQSKRRSSLKLGVSCALVVGVAALVGMLIQGCKREENQNPDLSNNQPPVDTNNYATSDTNPPPTEVSNPPVAPQPMANTQPQSVPVTQPQATTPPQQVVNPNPTPEPVENQYVIVKGDTLGKIAKQNGISLKILEDANPNVSPTKLHVGQKIIIPAGASTTGASAASQTENGMATSTGGDQVYVIKSGDTLTRIARHFGVTVKALMAENNLTTTHISVGKKLNIPAKPESASPVNTPPPTATPEPQTQSVPGSAGSSTPPATSPGTSTQPGGQQ
jgi:LysM repeat protein